ncbi:MAG: Fe-S cluster assembly scaffold protein NifU [Thermodesulfovibrionia bacterium]
MYSKQVMDHFTNPRNVGEMPDADGIGTKGNPVCGDVMKIFIKIKDNKIVDAKFQTFGCGAAIAVSSIITEMVKNKTLDEALKISKEIVAEELGGLPSQKTHCSNLGADALHQAIYDYRQKKESK